ncbi:MAG: hypothetical protein ACOCX4_04140 [Planctomycetota bacterium]
MERTLETLSRTLGNASVSFDGETLHVSTGRMATAWRWTGRGFRTFRTEHLASAAAWAPAANADSTESDDADWTLPVIEGGNPPATLVATDLAERDDDGFTAPHLCFSAELHYAEVALALRWTVWAYPDAPGLRTALSVRALDGYAFDAGLHRRAAGEAANRIARLERGYVVNDSLPLDPAGARLHWIGYHSDTQHRNDPALDLLLEHDEPFPPAAVRVCEWANAACIERDGAGLALVKESHKCANTPGHDTGDFAAVAGHGLLCRGWGVLPQEIDETWRPAWATWRLAWAGNGCAREAAFKAFDRLRYPVRPRDVRVQANTWGSSEGYREHRDAAGEAAVLAEIDACADLGIEVLQIDDGWQGNRYDTWTPTPDRHPHGWRTVREHAAARGVDLGLWMAAQPVALEDLQRNRREGGFVSYKLDFAVLRDRAGIDALMQKVRAFVHGEDHAVRIDWDLTEVMPRYGYFFAREFGLIYLENRKPVVPRNATYRPATVLRDLWQTARYCNLLKFQGSVQNVDRVDPMFSDAARYGHAYCVAMTLMSSPLFFQQVALYDEAARDAIRPVLAAYLRHRDAIRTGTIHPIGERPTGASRTGFQCVLPEGRGGYLTLFREPDCPDAEGAFDLVDLAGTTLTITDCLTGETETVRCDADGNATFALPDAPGFRFLHYTAD